MDPRNYFNEEEIFVFEHLRYNKTTNDRNVIYNFLPNHMKKYTDYYFGVDRDELGGSITNEYTPDGAFEFGAGLYGEYYFTKNISALAYVNMKQYSSEVTKSPITEDRIITNVGAGLKYTF